MTTPPQGYPPAPPPEPPQGPPPGQPQGPPPGQQPYGPAGQQPYGPAGQPPYGPAGQPPYSSPPAPQYAGGYGPPAAHYAGGYGPPNSGHPVQLSIARAQSQNRVLALFSIPAFLARILAAIPVAIVLYFVGIAMVVVAWIAMWAILFTGHYPEGMHRFVSGVIRWQVRTNAWVLGLTDSYPGFSMAP